MRDKVKMKKMTKEQLGIYAYRTCQWWNAVFIQWNRFREAMNKQHGTDPWTEEGNDDIFIPERMFLIEAVFHAVEGLEKINIELQRDNDNAFQRIINEIETVVPLMAYKDLRDMNEHELDYLIEEGDRKGKYITMYEGDKYAVRQGAGNTYYNKNMKIFLLGSVPIEELVNIMKKNLPIIWGKTEELFYRMFNN